MSVRTSPGWASGEARLIMVIQNTRQLWYLQLMARWSSFGPRDVQGTAPPELISLQYQDLV